MGSSASAYMEEVVTLDNDKKALFFAGESKRNGDMTRNHIQNKPLESAN